MLPENCDIGSTSLRTGAGDEAIFFRSAKVFGRAQDVFEDRDIASTWLNREIRSLGGVTPLSLIHSDTGFELVMHTLARIESGIPV